MLFPKRFLQVVQRCYIIDYIFALVCILGKEWNNMNETYVECLVKAKQSPVARFFRIFLVTLTVIFAVLGLLFTPLWIIALITGVGAYLINLFTDLEYEYLYLDKELTVDKVMNKTRRKRIATYEISRMEIIAPINSWHLDNYRNRQVKELDYSVGKGELPDRRYAMYYEGGQRILLSPSEDLMKVLKTVAPRKVFTD